MMKVKVIFDVKKPGPQIDPKIFGHFLENMGSCIYRGGLLNKSGNVRDDMVAAMKGLSVPVLRWPGGLFADGYDWVDGIGEKRPLRANRYWKKYSRVLGPEDPNRFGTDEFLGLCENIGAEPYINANLGTGTARQAADWVEYCNGDAKTGWGKARAENGREKPWNVKTWGIGNESFGFWAYGYTHPSRYAMQYNDFYRAMTERDSNIKPVAVGTCDIWPNWNPIVLSAIKGRAAYLSLHVYLPGNRPQYLCMKIGAGAANHYALSAAYLELIRKIDFVHRQIVDVMGEKSAIPIALDEWNLWWWWPQVIRKFWKMRDAVSVAGMAGAMVDRCEQVKMGNIAQIINVLGLLQSDYGKIVKTPLYHVLRLFSETLSGRRVNCEVDTPTFSAKKLGGIPAATEVPFLGAHGSVNKNKCAMVLIARRYEGTTQIQLEAPDVKFTRLRVLSGPSPEAANTFSAPDTVDIHEKPVKDGSGGLVVELPAASVAAVEGEIL